MIKGVDWSKRVPLLLLAAGACGMVIAAMPMIKKTFTGTETQGPGALKKPAAPAELVHDSEGRLVQPPRLRVSANVVDAFRLSESAMSPPRPATEPRELPPQIGTLAYDNEHLAVVRPRFPGELAQIAEVPMPQAELPASAPWPSASAGPKTALRTLAVGDHVKKGDLLAIVWSKDLGEKKGTLVDALIDLKLEEDRLKRYGKLYEQGALGEAT